MQRAKMLFASMTALSAALLALTACTGNPSSVSTKKDTVTIALSTTIPSLDPQGGYDDQSRAIMYDGAISEPLYGADPKTGSPIPVLATGVTNASPTEYDFSLRKGVKFQDGEAFNADAAVYSIKRFLNPATKALGVGFLAPIVKNVEATNSDTVRITTNGPAANLTRLLAAVNMVPPKYSASSPTALAKKPVGTGPYEFVSRTSDSVTLKAFPGYWGAKPTIKNIKFVALPDASGRVAALQTGQVDIAEDVPTNNVSDVPAVVADTKPEVLHLRFNSVTGITANPQLREALNLATDRETLRKQIIGEKYSAPIACQFGYSGVLGYNPSLTEQTYNLAEAKSLVQQLGDVGKSITIALSRDRYGSESVQYIQALASAWESIGLKVHLTITDTPTWISTLQLGPKSPDATLVGVDVDQFDIGQPFSQMILPGSTVAAYSPQDLKQTVSLIDAADAATSSQTRSADLQKASAIICRSNSFDFLYFDDFIYGKQKDVTWGQRVDGQLYLDTIKFTN